MGDRSTNPWKQVVRYLLISSAFPLACIGAPLTLAGSCVGAGWVVALSRGASAAELPDPTAIMYPVLTLGGGVLLLGVSGLMLVIGEWLRP
jgi:hypothetical protein